MHRPSAAVTSAALALGTLVGCGGSGPAARPVPHDRVCPGGETRPVRVQELIRVFRGHGLVVFDDPECLGRLEGAERQASNAPKFGPDRVPAGDAYDEVLEEQGYVSCSLWSSARRPGRRVREVRYPGDEETSFDVANVLCTIYPHRVTEREQVDRLRTAMTALSRVAANDR